MKKSIFIAAIMSCAFSATATAALSSDTIAVLENPTEVKVVETANRKKIIVNGLKGDEKYTYVYVSEISDSTDTSMADALFEFNAPFAKKSRKKDKAVKSIGGFSDIYTGAIIPAGAADGFHKAGWEIGMLNVIKAVWRVPSAGSEFTLGLGWWYRRMPVGAGMIVSSDRGNISLVPVSPTSKSVKSHLRAFGFSVPLTYYQRISKSFGIEIGGVAQLNTFTRAKASWTEDGVEHKVTFKGLHQRILTAEALVRVGFRGKAAIYARYCPMSMFAPEHGPETGSVAVGISLGF